MVLKVKSKEDYLNLRDQFNPIKISRKIRYIFVLESPPISGLYFYDPSGMVTEPLFMAMMKCVLNCWEDVKNDKNKARGLKKFQDEGYFLIDATYKPVNGEKKKKDKKTIIRNDLGGLKKDLKSCLENKKTPIILVKRDICLWLEPWLLEAGFNVVNKGRIIQFPSHGNQPKFCKNIKKILKK